MRLRGTAPAVHCARRRSALTSGREPRLARWRGPVAALLACAACGCVTAPPLPAPPPHQDAALAHEQPRVHGARGPLPPQQASRVLRRLERESDSDLLARHLRAVEDLIDAPLRVGNAAELLIDGPATHKAMLEAIEQARDHVNLETYIIDADAVGQRTADLLLRKRSEGVQVNLIYDSVGALGTPPEYFERLRQAGVRVCEYNPVNPLKARGAWRINNRDHRKLLVVDGGVAFAGGINISGVYSSGSFSKRRRKPPVEDGWRDTHIEVRGPIVADVQRLFLETWAKQCGEIGAADYFPRPRAEGGKVMRVVAGEPGESEIYPALLSAIERAERKVYLTVGYFVPDPRTLAALLQAARRGVDVRLALPGVSDFWAPLYAGRSHYEALLVAGVRIFERRDALLHAKTAVIDGVWSTVGSTNVDWRSFVHNAEANLIVLGEDFGERMEALFARDLEHSVEISEERWRRRSAGVRFKEWLARRWEYFL
jgi:cardiolipin synthase